MTLIMWLARAFWTVPGPILAVVLVVPTTAALADYHRRNP